MTKLNDILSANIKLTPMMAQYIEIKKNYPDTIVLYRMGDFYELFFEDAKRASEILSIALTHRGKLGDFPIPMAGIPYHAASTYIDRITNRGFKAVICEQIEDPKLAKGIVKRAVTQIVSPGMPFDLEKTNGLDTRYMAAGFFDQKYFLSLVDFTTGDFVGFTLDSEKEFLEKIVSYAPKELLTYKNQWNDHKLIDSFIKNDHLLKSTLPNEYFSEKNNDFYIEKIIPFYKKDALIKNEKGVLSPIAALSYYIFSTQGIEGLYHIRPFKFINSNQKMNVTMTTLMNLEILPRHKDRYFDSLLGHFDKTKTALGGRGLREHFINPVSNLALIENRHKILEQLHQNQEKLNQIREDLGGIRDIERILAKLSTKKINAQDILNLASAINIHSKLVKTLNSTNLLKDETKNLLELAKSILKTINPELGASLEKGNLINAGIDKVRDRLANLSLKANDEISKLEKQYREKTKINNLRIKYNNISGYFIEISKSHLDKAPKTFERRQTLVNAERFTTKELTDFEKDVVSASDKLQKLEREIFENLLSAIAANNLSLIKMSAEITQIDINQSLAYMISQDNLVKPQISSQAKKIFKVTGAWHPLIKANLKDQFVTHDLVLDEKKYFGLITGPNMAGKTTVMREIAIIQFLTQIGSFVPCKSVELSLCDALFARLGATDDILKGQSTFMVEMTETAEILRHATEKSLIIIDEIGRGTSTYDGLSIAWALVEYFINTTKALNLFSTHYHELIELVEKSENAKNLTVETINDHGNIQFLYKLIEKGATQSFGIHVAKLAGLPRIVLERSGQILKDLEAHQASHGNALSQDQMSFNFSEEKNSELYKMKNDLGNLDLANMTPLQAILKLYELQKNLN